MGKELKIIYTSDTHGHIFPVDYALKRERPGGLLAIAAQAEKDGNTLVLDGGDSLQGTPLSQYYIENSKDFGLHPVAESFNALGLDYYTLGNHDFNFGYAVLRDYIKAMKALCLCANLEDLGGELDVRPWAVHTLENGLRIGITGLVTDYVNIWEQPQNMEKLRVNDAFEAASKALEEMKGLCDLSVCIYHGGFEEDLESGRLLSDSGENIACRIARELGFDILLTGHQHMTVEGLSLCGTYAVQPPANAGEYIQLRASLEKEGLQAASRLIPVGDRCLAEPRSSLLPLEEQVQRWLDKPLGYLKKDVPPEEKMEAALKGSRVAALFNLVQLEATGADFSCTSLGNEAVGLSSPVTMRGVTAAYLFANTLVVLEVTEEVIRRCLERCAEYFSLTEDGVQVSQDFLQPKVEHYNYDFYAGLNYTLDLRRPLGQRVVGLSLPDGSPLGKKKYRLCTSNYRATGTGGYDVLKSCPVLWRGGVEMPDLTAQYIQRHSPVSLDCPGRMEILL
ncbi:MAG TPA: bifunctional metallophosphatase/5'-nucleotidase [Candidatus Limivicinus faecipullorum]|nr:bifunctional metallophosphatase/5'-nucleotidase [Candidatus Limivicinus faecipullorum]